MSNRIFKYYNILLFLTVTLSCQEDELLIEDSSPNSFSEIFDIFWNKMNSNYLFWDIDTTDWSKVKSEFQPLFAELDINNINDLKKSVSYLKKITSGLIDGHFTISFLHPHLTQYLIHPSWERKEKSSAFHYPYAYKNVIKNYLDNEYLNSIDNSNLLNGQTLEATCGTINNSIIYFSCNRLTLLKSYTSTTPNSVQTTLNYFFAELYKPSTKAVILDLRGNSGGDLGDLNFLLGHFVNKPLHFGYTQYKSDINRMDYTPWIKAYINPQLNLKAVGFPVIILADNYSASLSEFMVMAVKLLPDGLFIGEKTWGATGAIVQTNVYDSGQFDIPNFLSVKTSSVRFKYIDEQIYEGIGITPDITVPFSLTDLNMNKDQALEKAVEIINKY